MSYPSLIIAIDDVIVLESLVGTRNEILQRKNSSHVSMSTSLAFLCHENKLHASFSCNKRKNLTLDNCIMKITS